MSNYNIITFEELDSTNSYILENLENLKDRDVLIAKRQTKGRGRFNRVWVSDENANIYMSLLLKQPICQSSFPSSNLTQYMSVILCKVLEDNYGLKPSIKWPNDVLYNGAKIAGILCEAKKIQETYAFVLGLGVNVNLSLETISKIDKEASSLTNILGRDIDANKLISLILDAFFKTYKEFIQVGFSVIKDDYINRCDFLGKKIKISNIDNKSEYTALKIDDKGFLIVLNSENQEKTIVTGDLTYC